MNNRSIPLPHNILSYEQCESLKSNTNNENDIHLAHYHRFLSSLADLEIGLYLVPEDTLPTFEEYINWKKIFNGWSFGKLSSTHSAWQEAYWGQELPMNDLYRLAEFYNGRLYDFIAAYH